MLDLKTWLDAAQATGEGRSRRVDHHCGGGRTLKVSNQERGWSAFCFRCDDTGYFPKPQETLSERIARRGQETAQDARAATAITLPEPLNTDVATWPVSAAAWLYKAGIGKPEIAELGAYWHAPTARVVLPVIEGGKVVYWQARDTFWNRTARRPKYLNPSIDKQHLVAKYGYGQPLVLTEDVLSAFRVGQVTEAWSLLGTNLTDAVLVHVIERGGRVCVWLDPDPAGRKASRTIINQLMACGVDVSPIHMQHDPKRYSRREITLVIRRDTPAASKDKGAI